MVYDSLRGIAVIVVIAVVSSDSLGLMIPAILVIRRSKGSCNNCQNGWVGAAHVGSSPLQQIMGAQGKRESDCGFSHIGVHGGIYHQLLLMCNVVLWVCCCRL